MMYLYLALAAIVAAAFVGMLWLKRESDRSWLVHMLGHKPRHVTVQIVADTSEFERQMRAAGEAARRVGAEMRRMRGPLEQLGRDMDDRLDQIRRSLRTMRGER